DGQRAVTITADLLPGFTAGTIINRLQRQFKPQWQQQYPQVQWVLEGESEDTAETGGSLLISFMIGLFMVYGILSVQFGSYRQPLVVMSLIPLAFIGVVWGHVLMGMNLSMPSLIGFVSLSGIVVNDAILLVGVIRQQRPHGSVLAAVIMASRSRFRAVLLTSLTTIAGLLPLMLETSLQAQVLIPLVVSIVFGLLATTLLVLLVVPVIYATADDWLTIKKD
ncbi:MAG TPA: efflux RND transporter permease subunit, partial [Candidatus Paceibacterota bacterium]|nr:efflux RND transporter permease subunit [Candidatus Paceibacterota bacterium]